MAKSASILTTLEAETLKELAQTGRINYSGSEVALSQLLNRMHSKGLIERVQVPAYKVSAIGAHALKLYEAMEEHGRKNGDGSGNQG